MKQAIGYIRVSTEKQANEGVSLEAQEAKIVTWCKANGYELVKVYVDAGISGKRMDTRKELLAALASLKKGMALVSYSLSRLARSTKDALAIGEAVAKKKADMVSLTEQIDTTTAAGKMMFQMLSVFSSYERAILRERILSGLRRTTKKSGRKPMPDDRVEAIRKSLRDGLGIRATARLHRASTTSVTNIKRSMQSVPA